MFKNSIKNFLTVVLIVLALYQTTELWFEDSWSHNFFYTFFSNQNNYDNTTKPFYSPYRIITSDGSKNYNMFFSNIDELMHEQSFEELLKSINNLEYVSKVDIRLDEILESRAVLFEYNFPMRVDYFLESASKKNSELSANVKQFDSFALVPSIGPADPDKYYFISEDSIYQFNTKQNKNFEKLYSWFKQQDYYGKLNYDISKDLQIMKNDIFIPKFKNVLEYDIIKTTNPYKDSNGLDQIYDVGPKTDIFFENPSARIAKPGSFTNEDGDYYVFSDLSQKVVYYYPGNQSYIEYHNYKVSNTEKMSLVDSYNIAINFINKDLQSLSSDDSNFVNKDVESLSNDAITFEYYLDSYKPNENNTTFYFDYTINNFKILLSENKNLKHHIEITVENETVTNYKKIALNYEISKDKDYAKIGYQQVLDEQDLPIGDNTEIIYNILLGYKTEANFTQKTDDDMYLNWFFDFKDSSFSYPTKKAGD